MRRDSIKRGRNVYLKKTHRCGSRRVYPWSELLDVKGIVCLLCVLEMSVRPRAGYFHKEAECCGGKSPTRGSGRTSDAG